MFKIFFFLSMTTAIARFAYGWWLNRQFEIHCGVYLRRAANANDIKNAKESLYKALMYAHKRGLTEGNTSVVIYDPNNDIGFWYDELSAAYDALNQLPANASVADRTWAFDRIRQYVAEDCRPGSLAFYPYHRIMFWAMGASTFGTLLFALLALFA